MHQDSFFLCIPTKDYQCQIWGWVHNASICGKHINHIQTVLKLNLHLYPHNNLPLSVPSYPTLPQSLPGSLGLFFFPLDPPISECGTSLLGVKYNILHTKLAGML